MRNHPNLWTGGTVGMTLRVPGPWRSASQAHGAPRDDAELETDRERSGLAMGDTLGLNALTTYSNGELMLDGSNCMKLKMRIAFSHLL